MLRMWKGDKTMAICQMSESAQDKIRQELMEHGLEGQELEEAMNGRLCDVEDTIDIEYYSLNYKEAN